jgi:hypothetical protein
MTTAQRVEEFVGPVPGSSSRILAKAAGETPAPESSRMSASLLATESVTLVQVEVVIPGPKLLGQVQPTAAVDREELVKVDTHFQRRRRVEDEPEPVEDPAHVPELGKKLQRDLAVAGGEGDVEVRGLGHVPVGRKLHGEIAIAG